MDRLSCVIRWRFHYFFYMLLAPTLLHVAASLLVSSDPIETGEGPVHSQFETVRIPFIVVMALFSIVVTLKGLVVGARRGCLGPCAVTQRIVAGLVLITYVTAGSFFRFVPGAFGS